MKSLVVIAVLLAFVVPSGVFAQNNHYSYSNPEIYYHNLAVSASMGAGLPVGNFSNSRVGNAGTGGVANFQAEYYVSSVVSLGFEFSRGVLEDEDDNNFDNRVNNYQFFGRYLVPIEHRIRPYGKLNLGLSTITYKDQDFGGMGTLTSTSDPGLSLAMSGGAIWRASDLIGINGGIGYHTAFLEGEEIENSGQVVPYDPSYFSVDLGISFFFRR